MDQEEFKDLVGGEEEDAEMDDVSGEDADAHPQAPLRGPSGLGDEEDDGLFFPGFGDEHDDEGPDDAQAPSSSSSGALGRRPFPSREYRRPIDRATG